MKKSLLILLIITGVGIAGFYLLTHYQKRIYPLPQISLTEKGLIAKQDSVILLEEALELLRIRKDNPALLLFEKVLVDDPENQYALWGKAEVLRRRRDYKQSEEILNKLLAKEKFFIPALISLSYIRYKNKELDEAKKLLDAILEKGCGDRHNLALVYMMRGSINSKRSKRGWLFSKLRYGTQIRCHFLKAKELAPELPEVHLGLGTFYLLAPALFGGNLNKAIEELETAVEIAPEFATANARLAQAYKRCGEEEKYKYYIKRAKQLDPENEVLQELNQ